MNYMEKCEQQAADFYLYLQGQIEQNYFEDLKAYIDLLPVAISPNELEMCSTFSNLCRSLRRKGKISPMDHGFLMGMFQTVGNREDLRVLVQEFDRSQNKQSDIPIPLTCLYNKDNILPINERLDEFLGVLDKFLHEPSNGIPQQLFYTNVAAGIARPDRDLSLELGDDEVVVSIPEGTVKEKKIIYCHFVDDLKPCLLEDPCFLEVGKKLVCYSIPVFLGPTGEEFDLQHCVVLDIAHNIAPTKRNFTADIKFYVRQDGDELWRDGGRHFCKIGKDNRAMIHLRHFSEFVLGVDPSTTTTLPPLRARMITIISEINENERCLVICILFDSAFMIKKVKQMLRERKCKMDVATSQIVILEPRVTSKINVQGRRWTGKDEIQDVTPDELDMLVFNPVYREMTMIQEEKTEIRDPRMCSIAIIQNNQSQNFFIYEDSFKLCRLIEDEGIIPEHTESRTKHVAPEASATILSSFLAELDRQRTDFKERIDAVQENHVKQTVALMGMLQEKHDQKQIDVLQENLEEPGTEHQKQINDELQEKLERQKTKHQKQIEKLQWNLEEQRTKQQKLFNGLQMNLERQRTEHQKQIDALQGNLERQRTEPNTKIDVLQRNIEGLRTELQKQIGVLQGNLGRQREDHQKQLNVLHRNIEELGTELQKQINVMQMNLEEQCQWTELQIEKQIKTIHLKDETKQSKKKTFGKKSQSAWSIPSIAKYGQSGVVHNIYARSPRFLDAETNSYGRSSSSGHEGQSRKGHFKTWGRISSKKKEREKESVTAALYQYIQGSQDEGASENSTIDNTKSDSRYLSYSSAGTIV